MCRSFHQSVPRSWASEARPAGPVSSGDTVRVSDAERNAVVEVLRTHTAEGRLTLDEFEIRTEEAFRARTGAELRAVLRELPPLDEPTVRAPRRPLLSPAVRSLLFVAAVLGAISLAVGHLVVWPLFVFGFWTFGCGGRSHDHQRRARVDEREELTLV